MPPLLDLTGKKIYRWTVLSRAKPDKPTRYLCRCDCGTEKIVFSQNLRRGMTTSCGCRRQEVITHHGMISSRAYSSWKKMNGRCENRNNESYKNYGGRGIKVCRRWKRFENFIVDMGHPPSDKHSIERINNNGNYEPSNCRWATSKEQANNKRTSRIVTHNGKTMTLTQWANILGIRTSLIYSRLKRGLSIEEALNVNS